MLFKNNFLFYFSIPSSPEWHSSIVYKGGSEEHRHSIPSYGCPDSRWAFPGAHQWYASFRFGSTIWPRMIVFDLFSFHEQSVSAFVCAMVALTDQEHEHSFFLGISSSWIYSDKNLQKKQPTEGTFHHQNLIPQQRFWNKEKWGHIAQRLEKCIIDWLNYRPSKDRIRELQCFINEIMHEWFWFSPGFTGW